MISLRLESMEQTAATESQPHVSRESGKSVVVAILLAVWLGPVAGHKFYLGEKEMGKLYIKKGFIAFTAVASWAEAIYFVLLAHRDEWEEYLNSPNYLDKKEAGRQARSQGVGQYDLPDQYYKEAKGDYVTKDRINKVDEVLDDDETVYYLTRGSTVDVEGSSAGNSIFGDDRSRKTGTRGYVRAVFTDKRVVIKVPQNLGNDERSIPYRNITSVDLDTGLQIKRISLQTPGQTYHIEAHEPGKEECREVVKFIRERIADEQTQESGDSQGTDPTKQLQNLKELHDEGAITDEEFEENRETLLEKI